jgi:hypothetical protein
MATPLLTRLRLALATALSTPDLTPRVRTRLESADFVRDRPRRDGPTPAELDVLAIGPGGAVTLTPTGARTLRVEYGVDLTLLTRAGDPKAWERLIQLMLRALAGSTDLTGVASGWRFAGPWTVTPATDDRPFACRVVGRLVLESSVDLASDVDPLD